MELHFATDALPVGSGVEGVRVVGAALALSHPHPVFALCGQATLDSASASGSIDI